jgi:peptidoglycan/xylan/chitin deacetylase (PgdA/CDA1 family)
MRGPVFWLLALALPGVLGGCRGLAPSSEAPTDQPVSPLPVRFLLTFDDGPSGAERDNTTARILDTLARNRFQRHVKAIFFIQTRHPAGGATRIGERLIARMHREGHQLGLHTASARGHINHTQMPLAELDRTLDDGIEDIRRYSGDVPRFLRPPYWAYNAATVARYEAHGLTMLLDDVSLGDGKVHGYTSNPQARNRIRAHLRRSARQVGAGDLPALNGYIPLVVTMHDTNPTTARDLEGYLGMLIEEARAAGLRVDRTPFVAPGAEIVRVANLRGNHPSYARSPGVIYR